MPDLTPDIIIDDDRWSDPPELKFSSLIKYTNIDQNLEFSLLLTQDKKIQQLNGDFRGKDKPTNVLSFPADEENYLGDIAVSYDTLEREAIEQGKNFKDHYMHMVIHGVLHLLGYDHETDDDAKEMESLEIKILADMGIKNPYTE